MSSSHSRSSSPSYPPDDTTIPPLLRSQTARQSTIDFATTSVFSESQRAQAHLLFSEIINYYNSYELSLPPEEKKRYNRGRLLQLMLEYVISDHGRDIMLKYFLTIIVTPEENPPTPSLDLAHILATLAEFEKMSKQDKDEIAHNIQGLADYLINHFFLPSKFYIYIREK